MNRLIFGVPVWLVITLSIIVIYQMIKKDKELYAIDSYCQEECLNKMCSHCDSKNTDCEKNECKVTCRDNQKYGCNSNCRGYYSYNYNTYPLRGLFLGRRRYRRRHH